MRRRRSAPCYGRAVRYRTLVASFWLWACTPHGHITDAAPPGTAAPGHSAALPPEATSWLALSAAAAPEAAPTASPADVPTVEPPGATPRRATFLVAKREIACAVLDDATVHCWGGGGFTGTLFGAGGKDGFRTPVAIAALRGASRLSLGVFADLLCGQADSGDVTCTHKREVLASPVTGHAAALAVGLGFACAVTNPGAVMCWGRNDGGVLGTASEGFFETPSPIADVPQPIGVTAAADRACAWTGAGTTHCWGKRQGDAGADALKGLLTPHLARARQIVSSQHQDCALRRDGQVRCSIGRRPIQRTNPRGTPLDGTGVVDAIDLAVGNQVVCAATKQGKVSCWGNGKHGRLGDGKSWKDRADKRARWHAPTEVAGLQGIVDIETSGLHTCARNATGQVWCFGRNNQGELGLGRSDGDAHAPEKVTGIDDARQLALGTDFTCALRGDGTVWCWGNNAWGQCGSGSTRDKELTPVRVALP